MATTAALGIASVATYGRHFGGAIAVEYARRHPQRCAMALADGFPVFAQKREGAALEAYLPPITPVWDGSHLTWLWFRCREQYVFWPWNRQTDETRAQADAPDLAFQHRAVVEMLEAGSDYRIGYAAAFRHEGLALLPDLSVPICFGNRPGDSQFKTLAQYPENAWTEILPRDPVEAARTERALLQRHPTAGEVPTAPPCAALADRTTPDYLEVEGLQILTRRAGMAEGAPVVLIHALPGSSALYEPLMQELSAIRRVVALDLPGHGESDPFPGGTQAIADHARLLAACLDRLGIAACEIYAHNGGAAVAVELCRQQPDRVLRLFLDAPLCAPEAAARQWAEDYAPDIAPGWDGAHLVRLWHHLRDQEIWWPWFDRRHESRRTAHSRIDPCRLDALATQLAKQPHSYRPAYQAAFRYPMRQALACLTTPTVLMTAAEDVFAPLWPHAAAVLADCPCVEIADTPQARTAVMTAPAPHRPLSQR